MSKKFPYTWRDHGEEKSTILFQVEMVQAGSGFVGFFSSDQIVALEKLEEKGAPFRVEKYWNEKRGNMAAIFYPRAGGYRKMINSIQRNQDGELAFMAPGGTVPTLALDMDRPEITELPWKDGATEIHALIGDGIKAFFASEIPGLLEKGLNRAKAEVKAEEERAKALEPRPEPKPEPQPEPKPEGGEDGKK